MVANLGNVEVKRTHRGKTIIVPTLSDWCPKASKKLRQACFQTWAALLFNACLAFIRNYNRRAIVRFKNMLNRILSKILDQPHDPASGYMPLSTDTTNHVKSNFILHWHLLLERANPGYLWH